MIRLKLLIQCSITLQNCHVLFSVQVYCSLIIMMDPTWSPVVAPAWSTAETTAYRQLRIPRVVIATLTVQ